MSKIVDCKEAYSHFIDGETVYVLRRIATTYDWGSAKGVMFVVECDKPEERRKGGRPRKVDAGKVKALADKGWTIAEIANDTGNSEETVKKVLDAED
jgi:hypothetical protein